METPKLFTPMPMIDIAATACSNLKAYAEKCMLDVFLHCYCLDYVGSKDNVNAMHAVTKVCKQISALSEHFGYPKSGHCFILKLDKLYDQYLEFIPNLPPNTTKCKIQLISQYYQALIE